MTADPIEPRRSSFAPATTLTSGIRPTPTRRRAAGDLLFHGKYRLEAPLATGGMSTVWRATHVPLDRPVALKFADFVDMREHGQDRFLREARLAATIDHPNVIEVLDFGIAENGEPVMAMELLDGVPLSHRAAREPRLGTKEIIHLMSQVLSALDAVHAAGILHRDLKLDNVVVGAGPDGEPFAWLIDFGIAFSTDPESELRRGRFGTNLHVIMGTPEYMAPEQAEGRPDLDVRVDVYAASVMLYELFAGRSPFAGEHPGRVLANVMSGDHVPLRVARPDLPTIAAVVDAGMSLDREARPASAGELRQRLIEAARARPTPTEPFVVVRDPVPPRTADGATREGRTREHVLAVIALALAVAIGALVLALRPAPTPGIADPPKRAAGIATAHVPPAPTDPAKSTSAR